MGKAITPDKDVKPFQIEKGNISIRNHKRNAKIYFVSFFGEGGLTVLLTQKDINDLKKALDSVPKGQYIERKKKKQYKEALDSYDMNHYLTDYDALP